MKDSQAPRKRSSVAQLKERITKLTALLDVAKAMSAERDLDALLKLILDEACSVLEADRCTIWVVDHNNREIWTRIAHGLKEQTLRIPVGLGIAGQVAQTGEVINIPDAYADARFNRQVDKDTGYRTRNILAVPMRHTRNDVTGVLQALNKKSGDAFSEEDIELAQALGASAAVAIQNALLYEDIDKLFEGFVHASVTAIEQRDPTTSGHSNRVALFTVGMAEKLQHLAKGPYKALCFSRDEMREIRYAALLHDFGKVGVRENVLIKEKKLYGTELELIEARFRARQQANEITYLRSIISALRNGGDAPEGYELAIEAERQEMENFLAFIRQCNEPAVLESESFARLQDLAQLSYLNVAGKRETMLSARELERLAIPVGSLDPLERLEIESHVTHTYRFLSRIPWTRQLRRIPEFAYGHHERLDGSGYPRQLAAEQIPVQTRMMTIADIYDALTAHDRPYKPAVPHVKALDILVHESKKGHVDPDLLEVFIEGKVHEHAAQTHTAAR